MIARPAFFATGIVPGWTLNRPRTVGACAAEGRTRRGSRGACVAHALLGVGSTPPLRERKHRQHRARGDLVRAARGVGRWRDPEPEAPARAPIDPRARGGRG